MNEIRNATVAKVFIGFQDHGFLTIMLHLDYGSSGQGFGGYVLGTHGKQTTVPHCGEWIRCLLELFEVDDFADIKGKSCRAAIDGDGFGKVLRIGHFLKDKWFDPEEINARLKETAR